MLARDPTTFRAQQRLCAGCVPSLAVASGALRRRVFRPVHAHAAGFMTTFRRRKVPLDVRSKPGAPFHREPRGWIWQLSYLSQSLKSPSTVRHGRVFRETRDTLMRWCRRSRAPKRLYPMHLKRCTLDDVPPSEGDARQSNR